MAKLNKRGHEILDSTPVAVPIQFKRSPTQQEQFRRWLRAESLMAAQSGQETFEEADDFDVGDDFDPTSPYEEHFDHQQNLDALKKVVSENKKRRYQKRSSEGHDREAPQSNASGKSGRKDMIEERPVGDRHSQEKNNPKE